MKKNLAMEPIKSSFLSCEKDFETILRRLFIESKPHNEELIRLLVLNTPDCLDNRTSEIYQKKIQEMSNLAKLKEAGYISLKPRIQYDEHADLKSYIIMSMDNFTANATNPQFRDCMIHFDIICPIDAWDLGNYKLRPLKIAGYIDGILNNSKLSGIGTLTFTSCVENVADENVAEYILSYSAIHGGEDTHKGDVLNG